MIHTAESRSFWVWEMMLYYLDTLFTKGDTVGVADLVTKNKFARQTREARDGHGQATLRFIPYVGGSTFL